MLNGTRPGGSSQLTTEEVQDIAGNLLVTGGTKTGIAITYHDAKNNIDYIVDHDPANNFVQNEHLLVAAIDHDLLLNFVQNEHILVGALDHDLLLNFETKEHFPNDGAFPTTWSDTSITGAELEDLSDGGATTIHSHASGAGSGFTTYTYVVDANGTDDLVVTLSNGTSSYIEQTTIAKAITAGEALTVPVSIYVTAGT